MLTIVPYILLRLFNKEHYLEGDEARHIVCAKNFYKLWNKSFYDMHPPLYSWCVKVMRSGVMVSLLSSIGLYFMAKGLYTVLGLVPRQMTVALTLLSFNYVLIYYSNRVFRYQLIVLLGTSMILSLALHNFILAGLLWGLLGLTCTYAGFRGVFIWAIYGFNPVTLIIMLPIFGSWFIQKAWVYSHNMWYPSGIEGKVERVNPFTWKQLLSPFYFRWTFQSEGKFLKWRITREKVLVLTLLILLSLSDLRIGLLTLLLMQPYFANRPNPRNFIIAMPLWGYLAAKTLPYFPLQWLYFASGCLLVGFLLKNRHLCFTPAKIKCRAISEYIDRFFYDGVMVMGTMAHFIALNTNKRVVVLPQDRGLDVAQMLLSIKVFDINYIVWSENGKKYYDSPVVEYVENNFQYLKAMEEDDDIYYVFTVPKVYRADKGQHKTAYQSVIHRSRQPCYN